MSDFTLQDLNVIMDSLGADVPSRLTPDMLDTSFSDLGCDSLTLYELVTVLQDQIGIAISDAEIDDLLTPRAVLDLVSHRRVVEHEG